MTRQKKYSKGSKKLLIVGGVLITAAGFMVMPLILKKYGSVLYKKLTQNEEVDFENMGPEITQKENTEEEKND